MKLNRNRFFLHSFLRVATYKSPLMISIFFHKYAHIYAEELRTIDINCPQWGRLRPYKFLCLSSRLCAAQPAAGEPCLSVSLSGCPSWCYRLARRASRVAVWPTTLAVSQHAVRADESISVPTWTRPQADECISVQKWNNQRGSQVLYRCCCGEINRNPLCNFVTTCPQFHYK